MRKIFWLNDEFKFKWMKRWGFWRLLWFAVIAKFGIITTNKEADDYGCHFSIGTSKPLDEYWDAGYECSLAGCVLGEVVIFYEPKVKRPVIL